MKSIILSVFLLSSGLMACSQDLKSENTPALVKNTLQAKFPDAIDIKWEKKKNMYEADFDVATAEYSALIDASGKIIMYKQDILVTELPAAVSAALQKNFADYTVEDQERIQKDGEVFYQVELEKNIRELKRVFGANGEANTTLKYWD